MMHPDIIDMAQKIKSMGLSVKIDTNGSYPEMLNKIISDRLADFIAMDVKNYLKYSIYRIAAGKISEPVFEKILKSISILMHSDIEYEFRTTLVKGIHRDEDILGLARSLSGSRSWALQNFNPGKVLDPKAQMNSFSRHEFESILRQINSIHHKTISR